MGKKKRPNRIRTTRDLMLWRRVIGPANATAIRRALADNASVWVFESEDEILSNLDLSDAEKVAVLKIFRMEKLGYAGWFRRPKPFVEFGITTLDKPWSH